MADTNPGSNPIPNLVPRRSILPVAIQIAIIAGLFGVIGIMYERDANSREKLAGFEARESAHKISLDSSAAELKSLVKSLHPMLESIAKQHWEVVLERGLDKKLIGEKARLVRDIEAGCTLRLAYQSPETPSTWFYFEADTIAISDDGNIHARRTKLDFQDADPRQGQGPEEALISTAPGFDWLGRTGSNLTLSAKWFTACVPTPTL